MVPSRFHALLSHPCKPCPRLIDASRGGKDCRIVTGGTIWGGPREITEGAEAAGHKARVAAAKKAAIMSGFFMGESPWVRARWENVVA